MQLALPQPGEGLLTEADQPPSKLVADPSTADDKQLATEKVYAGELAAYYRAKFRKLAGWAYKNLLNQKDPYEGLHP